MLLSIVVVWLPDSAEAATTRRLTITGATANPQVPFEKFDGNPPKVFDIDGDGKLEIIAQNDNQWVYVFDSTDGSLLFEAKTRFPSAGWGARSFNGPEVAIMEQGEGVRLIVANSAAFITSYRFDAVASTQSKFMFVKEWERRLDDCYPGAGMDAKPVLADLDKDGRFEILGNTEQQGLYALRDDGSLYWKNCLGGGNAEPTVADVNQDGWPDVVHVSDGGTVALLNGRTGGWMWGYRVLSHFDLGSASMPVGPAVGQLDGVGGLDIVVGVRDSHEAENFSQNHAMLLALDSGGKLLWARQDPTGAPLTYTHPVIGDADMDGRNEVYWGDWNTMGHKPPFDPADAFKPFGAGAYYRYERDGTLAWKQALGTYWSNKDLAIADVTGDGLQDVLANGPAANGHDGIWYLKAGTGAKQAFVDAWPYKISRAPIVADLWNTGTTQWVVQVDPGAAGSAYGLHVYDTGVAYNAMYPHLPYPTVGPAAPPPPTTAPGTKEAEAFANKTTGGRQSSALASGGAFWNLWSNGYIDDHLQSDGTSDVVIAARGTPANGAWPTLVLTIGRGSPRAFQVTSPEFAEYRAPAPTAGVHKIRLEFTNDLRNGTEDRNLHLDIVRLTGGGVTPPPPPAPFAATFTVTPDASNSWVSVRVTGSDSVAAVSAIVNGGVPVPLEKRSWGPWAKAFSVATCSKVQFLATSSTGQQNRSQEFTWLDTGTCAEPAPFSATFTPKSVGNDWWVAAAVTASETLTKVEARLDGGAWIELSKTQWDWAKSIHAVDGTVIEFRATGTSGATATSGPTVWT